MQLERLTLEDADGIIALASQLNPGMEEALLRERLEGMFSQEHYRCFGLRVDRRIVGICSGWLTTRFYSGRQLELDNVVVDDRMRGRGYGSEMLRLLEAWAHADGCLTVEFNAYVTNAGAHRFYFGRGYSVLGFHFQKKLIRKEE